MLNCKEYKYKRPQDKDSKVVIMQNKLRAGIIGATGYVGQRFVLLLADHPWFTITALAASPRSAGRSYGQAVAGRWKMPEDLPDKIKAMPVYATDALADWLDQVDLVFCAVDMDKAAVQQLEEKIARLEVPVISNNSAHRWTADVPMIVPELNPEHSELIHLQRRRLGTKHGFISVKPNCSIQSYVPALAPLMKFGPQKIVVATYQAISGAGKTFADWPEMEHNLIPYIGGEEDKSENEPLKIWGKVTAEGLEIAREPLISAQCYRVAVQDGHTAALFVDFANKPTREQILQSWQNFRPLPQQLGLPSAPDPFLIYLPDNDRPQPALDSLAGRGMAVSIGRLQEDRIFDWKMSCLSHNTIRGAAGGAVLTAELLVKQGFISSR